MPDTSLFYGQSGMENVPDSLSIFYIKSFITRECMYICKIWHDWSIVHFIESFHVIRPNLLEVRARTDPDLPGFGNILCISIEIA